MRKIIFVLFSCIVTQGSVNAMEQHRWWTERDRHGNAPLHEAVDSGQIATIKFLLDIGANINIQDFEGRTPLYRAVSARNKAAIRLLLERGANPNIRDYFIQQTPLEHAERDEEIAQLTRELIQKPRAVKEIRTLVMATHPRLGENSGASLLAEDGQHVILKNIFEHLIGEK